MTTRERQQAANPPTQPTNQRTASNTFKRTGKTPAPENTKPLSELVDELKTLNSGDEGKKDAAEMSKAVKAALAEAIQTMKGDDNKAKMQSLKNLTLLRAEVHRLGDVMGDEKESLLSAFDETIKHAKKTNGLLNSMDKTLKVDGERMAKEGIGTLKKGLEGFLSEASPFLKMGLNVTKGVYGFAKSMKGKADKLTDESQKALEAIGDGLSKTPDKATPEAVKPPKTAVSAPEGHKPQPKETATKVPRGEGPMVASMRQMAEGQNKQVSLLEKLINVLSVDKKDEARPIPTPAKGNPRQIKKSATKMQAASAHDQALLKPDVKEIKEAQKLQIELLEGIQTALKLNDGGQAILAKESHTENKIEADGLERLHDKLMRLDNINENLVAIVSHNKELMQMQKENLTNNSKERLTKMDDAREASAKAMSGKAAVDGKKVSSLVASESKALLGMLIPEVLGTIIGGVAGGGIIGGVVSGLKWLGSSLATILNPMNWLKGLGKLNTFIVDLVTPSKWITPLMDMIKTGASSLLKPFEFLGSVFGKMGAVVGEWFKPISKFLSVLGTGGKAIPIIGQVIAVISGIFSFFSGFFKAEGIIDKPKELLNIWDRFSAGLGALVGDIVGIIDSITSLFGFTTDLGGKTTKLIANFLSAVPDMIMEMFGNIKDSILGVVTAFSTSFADGVKELGKVMLKGMVAMIPGAETLMRKTGAWDALGMDENKFAKKPDAAPANTAPVPPGGVVGKPDNMNFGTALSDKSKPAEPVPTATPVIEPPPVLNMDAPDVDTKVLPVPEVKSSGGFADKARKTQAAITEAKDKRRNNGGDRPISVSKSTVQNVNTNNFNNLALNTRNFDDSHRLGL